MVVPCWHIDIWATSPVICGACIRCVSHGVEAFRIATEDCEAVLDFSQPEFRVGGVAGNAMWRQ